MSISGFLTRIMIVASSVVLTAISPVAAITGRKHQQRGSLLLLIANGVIYDCSHLHGLLTEAEALAKRFNTTGSAP